jgi:hypothetical protein
VLYILSNAYKYNGCLQYRKCLKHGSIFDQWLRLNSRRRRESGFQGGLEGAHSHIICPVARGSEFQTAGASNENRRAVRFLRACHGRHTKGGCEPARTVGLGCIGTTVRGACIRFETQKRDLKVDTGVEGSSRNNTLG